MRQIVFEERNRGTFNDIMSGKTVPKKDNPVEKRVSKKRSSSKIRITFRSLKRK